MKLDIPDEIAETFAFGRGRELRHAEQQIRAQINRSYVCTCGHTRHWHGQDAGAPNGSGACDDCECTTFEKATA